MRTILVLRALGLGDLLTAVPALRAIRRAFPEDRVVLATTLRMAPLATALGVADEVSPAEPLGRVCSGFAGCDVAINLHGSFPPFERLHLRRANLMRHLQA